MRCAAALLVGVVVIALAGLRLGGALTVPVAIFVVLLAAAGEWFAVRRLDLAVSGDIFAGQPSDADLLAELYDLEHDAVVEDLIFYREQTRRSGERGAGPGLRLRAPAAHVRRRQGAPHRGGRWLGRACCVGPRRGSPPSRCWRQPRDQGRLHLVHGDVRRLGQLSLRPLLGPAAPTWWWRRACSRTSTDRRTRCAC